MSNVLMEVNNPKQLITALYLARNAFLSDVNICVNNVSGEFASDLAKDIQEAVQGVYSLVCGNFPSAQTKAYSSRIQLNPWKRLACVWISTNYMSSEKERNDFTCIAAEIGDLLLRSCMADVDDLTKVKKYAGWIKQNFEYKNTESYADYSAVDLLRNRAGVCQAIAALAVKVLPYMGVRAQYMAGQGRGISGWENHAWNLVEINGEWIHVDFTFGLNSFFLPMTDNSISEKLFRLDHKWNENWVSSGAIQARERMQQEIVEGEILLIKNKNFFVVNEVRIYTAAPVYESKEGKDYIRICELVKYLDGGCEIDPDTGELRICVNGRVLHLENAPHFIYDDTDQFEKIILDICEIKKVEMNDGLGITFR